MIALLAAAALTTLPRTDPPIPTGTTIIFLTPSPTAAAAAYSRDSNAFCAGVWAATPKPAADEADVLKVFIGVDVPEDHQDFEHAYVAMEHAYAECPRAGGTRPPRVIYVPATTGGVFSR